ncbi:MAG TPA: DHH family phosphoesterase, partial [Gemmataceae bacterium]|nr:DHH family phosphoesterase [Gemmataceae bacterium]
MRAVVKTWHLLSHDALAIDRLVRGLSIPPIVAQLLLNRDQRDLDAADRFLKAPLSGLYEPERLPGMADAVQRLLAAIEQKKRICVYGDYDVDGVSGTAILLTALQHLGADVDFHVPHRLEDGYGLNNEALAKIAESGTSVVVTVDCGIASIAEADEARRLGLELIVTDHHEPKDTLPNADVLVHPRLPGDYPWGGLCGAGVAFKL